MSREIAKIPTLHIGGHEEKLPIFKRLKNIVEVKTLEKTFGKKSRDAEVSKAEQKIVKYFFLGI